MEISRQKLQETLQHIYGYKLFRPLQEEAIQSVLNGHDTMLIMPTGGGKSICFQLPAMVTNSLCLVISPLIALMKDQVQALQKNGVEAEFINSSLSEHENQEIMSKAKAGTLRLLYVSPERLVGSTAQFNELPIRFIAIDEAHCVSQWGHDFRPEYTQLKVLKEHFPKAPIMALTATADKTTRNDIGQQLGMTSPKVLIGSFNRTNLSLDVRPNVPAKDRLKQISTIIERYNSDSGIIYCLSRKGTEKLAAQLTELGVNVGVYHAGLSHEKRNKVQDDFINDRVLVICATIAFGMGIDKSNVRYVLHYNLPKNLESYYQEIGRAGRDGLNSETRLYYNYGDLRILTQFASEGAMAKVNIEKLNRMHQYAEADVCRRKILLSYFGEILEEDCGNCDVCKNPRKHFDGTIVAQKALSALKRMKELVGMNLLIDVLRGSSKAEVVEKGYDKIKTYGAGREFSYFEWQHFINQMLNHGLLEIAYDDNFNLKLTEFGLDVLYGKRDLKLVVFNKFKEETKKTTPKRTKKEQRAEGLFGDLKALRLEISREENAPAYTIFNDATLTEMAEMCPLFLPDLAEINGVGAHKLKKYGEKFLGVIRHFAMNNKQGKIIGLTYLQTLIQYMTGESPETIAEAKGVNVGTIYGHLALLIDKGEKINVSTLLSKQELQQIEKAVQHFESYENLGAIHEYLNESIHYGLLKVGINYLLKKGKLRPAW